MLYSTLIVYRRLFSYIILYCCFKVIIIWNYITPVLSDVYLRFHVTEIVGSWRLPVIILGGIYHATDTSVIWLKEPHNFPTLTQKILLDFIFSNITPAPLPPVLFNNYPFLFTTLHHCSMALPGLSAKPFASFKPRPGTFCLLLPLKGPIWNHDKWDDNDWEL